MICFTGQPRSLASGRGRSLFDSTRRLWDRKRFDPRVAMPADGKTAASSPPGDIGDPGSGSEATIHRLCFAPEVKTADFINYQKSCRLQLQRDGETGDNLFGVSRSLCLRRTRDRADMYQEVRQSVTDVSTGLRRKSRRRRDQNHDCLNQEPDRCHNKASLGAR